MSRMSESHTFCFSFFSPLEGNESHANRGDAADMSRKNNLVPGEKNIAAKDLKVMDERERPCFFFFLRLVFSFHPSGKQKQGREEGRVSKGRERKGGET